MTTIKDIFKDFSTELLELKQRDEQKESLLTLEEEIDLLISEYLGIISRRVVGQ